MKIRIQYRKAEETRLQQALGWAETILTITALLILSFCGLVYFQGSFYQFSERARFKSTRVDDGRGSLVTTLPHLSGSVAKLQGAPVSRIEIPRLGMSVVVVEGVRPQDLRIGAGHVPGTAFPGESGNIGIAGHRDTFFRPLSSVREQDEILMTTDHGTFQYSVESMEIVDPSNVEVLAPSSRSMLTLVTCYPFFYAGSAPQRYIVRARQKKREGAHVAY